MDVSLTINGLPVSAHYDDDTVQALFLPMLRTLTERQRALGRRMIVFLAAPPAVGKSTLAAFLEQLSHSDPTLTPVQALGMDGFHYHQNYILSHSVLRNGEEIPMRLIKGAPESFDAAKLHRTLSAALSHDVLWPFYDRRLHDVVEDAIPVSGQILLIEGNWLLLDAPVWRDLPRDFSIFIGAEASILKDRLTARKMQGGFSQEDAEAHVMRSDLPNVVRCMEESLPADLVLRLTADGKYCT